MRHFHYECCHSLSYSGDHAGAAWLTDLTEGELPGRPVGEMTLGLGSTGNQSQTRGKESRPCTEQPRRERRIPDRGSQLSQGGTNRGLEIQGGPSSCCDCTSWSGSKK